MIRLRRVARSLPWNLFRVSGEGAPRVRKFFVFCLQKQLNFRLILIKIIGFEMWQKLAVQKHD